MQDWIGTTQAAAYLGLSPAHLRQLILNGKVDAKRFGDRWFISVDDLEELADEFEEESNENEFDNEEAEYEDVEDDNEEGHEDEDEVRPEEGD